MGRPWLSAVGMLAIPLVVFCGLGAILTWATGKVAIEGAKRINLSLHYDRPDVESYWRGYQGVAAQPSPLSRAGQETGLDAEHRFLELDLIFPVAYVGALAACLIWAWSALRRPFHVAWILVPMALVLLGDWTENVIQLSQITRFEHGLRAEVDWIAAASLATAIKIVFLVGGYLALLVLAGRWVRIRGSSAPASAGRATPAAG